MGGRRDATLPPEQQGLMVLGTPLRSAAYVQATLQSKREAHDALLDKIPGVPDLQSAWLLLLLCGATRANYWLRVLPPQTTLAFARKHDAAVARCLADLLANDAPHTLDTVAMRRAQLPFAMGGLGLRSAVDGRYAAYWASWADTLPTLQARHPHVVEDIRLFLSGAIGPLAEQAPSTVALAEAASHLQCQGFTTPPWAILVGRGRPPQAQRGREFVCGRSFSRCRTPRASVPTPSKRKNQNHKHFCKPQLSEPPTPLCSEETDSGTCHTTPSPDSPESPDSCPDYYPALPSNNMKDPGISSCISHLHPPPPP